MSYAEKYRGTPWGRPEPEPPPSPGKGRRSPLLIAGLVLAGVAIVGTAAVYVGSPHGTPAAAVPSQPADGPAADTASRANPTPTPTVDPGEAVKASFWTLVSDPKLSYHITASGRTTVNRKLYESYKEAIDVVGDDYSGWIRSSYSGKAKLARKDGVIWVKLPGKRRIGRQTSERYFRLTPFLYLEMAAWVDYVKPVTVNGRHLHLLRSNRYYRPDVARMFDLSRFQVVPDTMVLDLYVTDAGVPVSAVFTADVDVGLGVNRQVFHGRTAFTFTKVGAKLKIVVPKR